MSPPCHCALALRLACAVAPHHPALALRLPPPLPPPSAVLLPRRWLTGSLARLCRCPWARTCLRPRNCTLAHRLACAVACLRCVGGSLAHSRSRISFAALGLALASALVIAPSLFVSPAPSLSLPARPRSLRPAEGTTRRSSYPACRRHDEAELVSGLQKARRGGARIRPAALRLQEADPSQEYVAKGCPGMTACSSHSPWPFWPVSPPFWSLSSGCFGIFLT